MNIRTGISKEHITLVINLKRRHLILGIWCRLQEKTLLNPQSCHIHNYIQKETNIILTGGSISRASVVTHSPFSLKCTSVGLAIAASLGKSKDCQTQKWELVVLFSEGVQ